MCVLRALRCARGLGDFFLLFFLCCELTVVIAGLQCAYDLHSECSPYFNGFQPESVQQKYRMQATTITLHSRILNSTY